MESHYYSWYDDSEEWSLDIKREYTYDENGNQTSMVFNSRSGLVWITMQKNESTYDDKGNETSFYMYLWDNILEGLVGFIKQESAYDDNGNRTLEVGYDWDNELQDFIKRFKSERTYDDNDKMTSFIWYNWDKDSGDWIEDYKYEYGYDDNGNQTSSIRYIWKITSDAEEVRSSSNGEWVLAEQTHYYYSEHEIFTGIKEVEATEQSSPSLLIYPNPVVESVTITGVQDATIVFFDMQGRTVYTQKAAADEVQITVSAWISGVYVVRVIGDDGSVRSAKLVKR